VGRRQRRREGSTSSAAAQHDQVRRALFAAAAALHHPDPRAFQAEMDGFRRRAVSPKVQLVIGSELGACLDQSVHGPLWANGWQPADLAGVSGRALTAAHRRLAVDVIAAGSASLDEETVHPRWAAQLDELDVDVWWSPDAPHLEQWAAREGLGWIDALVVGIELLALLLRLPKLPRLIDPPGVSSRPRVRPVRRPIVDDDGRHQRMLAKVRALLAKAESTTFPEEAEALTAKAQELMARHAIDDAMVDASAGTADAPIGVRLQVDAPYASPKSLLLAEVASANRCRAVWSGELGFTTVFGFESDVDFVEVLYTSLLVQATRAMAAAGSVSDRYGRSRTRSFRTSFLVAYASRIGQRLREAEAAGRAEAEESYGAALLPVLADRTSAVEDAFRTVFPRVGLRSVSSTNLAGWAAGAAAADQATLSSRPEVRARQGS
jgi:hypothetical protein